MAILLNGFYVGFSAGEYTAFQADWPDGKTIKELRDNYGDEWFFRWYDGKAYGLPRVESPKQSFGSELKLSCLKYEGAKLLSARLAEILTNFFPKYNTHTHFPYSFLAKKSELVSLTTKRISNLNPLVNSFTITPRFVFEPRILEFLDERIELGLFLDVKMQWKIEASLEDLVSTGISLNGLYVVRKNPSPGQKRLVGRIGGISQGTVHISESSEGLNQIGSKEVFLEGSQESFARCLRHLLGYSYRDYLNNRFIEEGEFLTGPKFYEVMNKILVILEKKDSHSITPDLNCYVNRLINVSKIGCQIERYSDVEYCYNAGKSKRNRFAWEGLEEHGPYSSRESIGISKPSFLIICPESFDGTVDQFMHKLLNGITTQPYPKFQKGFTNTFGFKEPILDYCYVKDDDIRTRGSAKAYYDAIHEKLRGDFNYSAAISIISDQDSCRSVAHNPYYAAKALLLMHGIPVQQIREYTLKQKDSQLQYALQNFSIALYSKLGGIPWTVDHDQTYHDEIVLGMGTCELSGSRFLERQRYVGITTVFRGDGNYLLSNVSKECKYEDYPVVLKETMISVLKSIKKRNGWQKGDKIKIVFHAHKPLKNIEVSDIIEECIRAVSGEQTIKFAFLTITHDHCFKIIDTSNKNSEPRQQMKGEFVPQRGTSFPLGKYTRLLSIQAPHLVKKVTTPIPKPLLVHWHQGSTYYDIDYLTEQALKFTSLSWKSVHPTYTPVTICYSEIIAEALVKLKEVTVTTWSPAQLETTLQESRWFL